MKFYKAAAREYGRIASLFLLSLLILASRGFSSAPAYADTIGNGQFVPGSVTGAGTESWDFNEPNANFYAYILGSINVATPDPNFKPGQKVFNPDGSLLFATANNPNTFGQWGEGAPYPQTGTYSILGYNLIGAANPSFVANFTMNISVSNLPYWQSPGGVMDPNTTYPGTQQYAAAAF